MKNIILSMVFLWVLFLKGESQTTTKPNPITILGRNSSQQNLTSYDYPPQTFGFASIVKSGPIVFVNKKTVFISNIRYDKNYEDAYFWVGKGTEPTTNNGQLVPDENGSTTNLNSYQGQNIYLAFPANITTDDIEYFAVWSRAEEISLGYVVLTEDLKRNIPPNTGYEQRTENGRPIMRVPKCCQFNSVLSSTGCVENYVEFKPSFKIFEHNQTHVNNESLNIDNYSIVPYTNSMTCSAGKYALDNETENFGILLNGSLIAKSAVVLGILSQGEFCVDNVIVNGNISMRILVCAPEIVINHAMFRVYIALLIISMLCFAGAFILYCFVLDCKTVPKKCFMGYALWMCITFFCLTIIQIAYVEEAGCTTFGFFFELSMMSSFTWLAILCFDILFIVIHNDDPNDHSRDFRLRYYLGITIAVPLLFIIISLSRNLTPDVPDSFFKPQYGRNPCYFEEANQRRIIFYLPIGICVFVSGFCLAFTKYKIIQGDKNLTDDYFWMENIRNFKFTFRQCFFAWSMMSVCWLIDVISSFLDDTSGIYNAMIIIEALQGVFIVLVFTMDHYTKKYLDKDKSKINSNVELDRLNA